jgi:hypothetical protein
MACATASASTAAVDDRCAAARRWAYQAWPAPQWGQTTVVETLAWKTRPHSHE